MKFGSSNSVPLRFRVAAIAVSLVLALSLLELWAGGVRFMKLLGHVAGQIAATEAAKHPEAQAEAPPETPGVVSVGIIPTPNQRNRP